MSGSPKPPDLPPYHEPNHIEYVGLIASQWATLEFYIDSTCWRLAAVSPEVGACFSANLGSIHFKLRTLYALLELHNVNPIVLKSLRTFQGKVSGTADKRNRVVHHPWMPYVSPKGSGMSQFVYRADQKGREFGGKPVPLNDLVSINQEIMKRIGEIMKLRERIADSVPTWSEKQRKQQEP
jgi:hypothetical protein